MTTELIASLLEKAISESQKLKHSRKEWTDTIKRHFVEQARKEKLYTCASNTKNANWGEWLYDLVVLKCDGESELIEKTVLVLESEWDHDDQSILEDFQKLLLSNSDYKVLVYFKNKEIIEELRVRVAYYTKSSGIFILAHLPSNDSVLEVEIINGNSI